jgi:uncharacterized membrane protein (UPF0182 family)
VARASVASPTFFPLSCRRFHRYYLRKPDGILLSVDALWFGSLGYVDVFRKTLSIRWAFFAASFAATFFILYGWFLALRRAYQPDLLSSGIIYIAKQPVKLRGERILRLIAVIVTLLVAAATAAAMSGGGMADVRALLVRAARNGGIVDPIFGRSLHFYLFPLPGWQLITGWPLTLAVTLVGLPSSLF